MSSPMSPPWSLSNRLRFLCSPFHANRTSALLKRRLQQDCELRKTPDVSAQDPPPSRAPPSLFPPPTLSEPLHAHLLHVITALLNTLACLLPQSLCLCYSLFFFPLQCYGPHAFLTALFSGPAQGLTRMLLTCPGPRTRTDPLPGPLSRDSAPCSQSTAGRPAGEGRDAGQ